MIEDKIKLEKELESARNIISRQHQSINSLSKKNKAPEIPKLETHSQDIEVADVPSPPLPSNQSRPLRRATEEDLDKMENQVRQKISKIYEKIDTFVAKGVVDPNEIKNNFPQYEHLNFDSNRGNNQISRNITPEAGEFNFQITPEGSLTNIKDRTTSFYSVKETIPETIIEEDENGRQSIDRRTATIIPSIHSQSQMIQEAEALHLTILKNEKNEQIGSDQSDESETDSSSSSIVTSYTDETLSSDDKPKVVGDTRRPSTVEL